MAGGGDLSHGGDFRAKVWSMSGGPYCRPKHWQRNTAIALAGIVLICIPVALKSAELEEKSSKKVKLSRLDMVMQRPHLPVRPIPSQLWCKNFGTKDY